MHKEISTFLLALTVANSGLSMQENSPEPMDLEPETTLSGYAATPLDFKQAQKIFELYQESKDPIVRTQLIDILNRLIILGKLVGEDKLIALEIAKAIDAENLSIRLHQNGKSTEIMGVEVPPEVIRLIVSYLLNSDNTKDLKNLLMTSKGFNEALLVAPVNLDLTPYAESLDDDTLGQFVQLFPNMNYLNISKCHKITDAGVKHLEYLTSLTYLNLNRVSNLTNVALSYLKKLETLTTLILGFQLIDDDGLKYLRSLRNLETLDLSWTQITDVGVESLKHLKNLRELDLSYTPVTLKSADYLKDFPSLENVNLMQTNIKRSFYQSLRSKVPMKVKINF